jgi:hypothetical protein
MPNGAIRVVRAYFAATVVFAFLHGLLTVVGNQLSQDPPRFVESWQGPLIVLAYALYVVAGFVAGAIEGRRPVIHGIVAGVLSALVAVLVFRVALFDPFGVFALTANGLVLGGVGGACSMPLRRKNAFL